MKAGIAIALSRQDIESAVIKAHPNGDTVYALGNEFGGFIAIVDLRRSIDYATYRFVRGQSSMHLDGQVDLAFSSDGTRAFLPGTVDWDGKLFIVDTSDPWEPVLVATINLNTPPSNIALSRDGRAAYLASQAGSSVSVFDIASSRISTTVPLQAPPVAIVVGSGNAPVSPVQSGDGCQVGPVRAGSAHAFLLVPLVA